MIKLKDLLPEGIKLDELVDVPPPQKIQDPPAIVQSSSVQSRQEKMDLLTVAACAILEAGGEQNADGMQAVLNVVQNRAKKSHTSLSKQVLKQYQFSAFNPYTVSHSKKLESIILEASKHPKWNLAVKLSKEAIDGTLKDITDGSDHYYANWMDKRNKTPDWASVYKFVKQIGNHKFFDSKKSIAESIIKTSDTNERIVYLKALLDANHKWHNSEDALDEDGEHIMRRIFAFEKKWNRPPLKLSEISEVENEIVQLKKQKYKNLYKLNENLNELFDNPWSFNRDDVLTQKLRDVYYPNGCYNLNAFKLEGNNGYIVTFVKDHAWEVHHASSDFVSGKLDDKPEKSNPRFYSTIIYFVKEKLNRGADVRIISSKESYEHYKKVIEKLIDLSKYNVEYDIPVTEDPDFILILIKMKNKTPFNQLTENDYKELGFKIRSGYIKL